MRFRPRLTLLEDRTLLSLQPTTTAITTSASVIVPGQSVTFTATVESAALGAASPTGGTVTFKDGTTVLGTRPLGAGSAQLTVSTLPLGVHTVTASYSGDGVNFAPSPTGTIVTLAGNGNYTTSSGDGGPATSASLDGPSAVAVDSAGNLYITEYNTSLLRFVSAAGQISTLVPSGSLNHPSGVAVDSAGNVFIADTFNNRICEVVKATGNIIAVAGTGTAGYNGNGGPATSAQLNHPATVAVDSAGNVYIADTNNNQIREVVKATGNIIAVAGTGAAGFSGDGGPATLAQLKQPAGLAVDSAFNVYFNDDASRIREVVRATGTIVTVAGTGTTGGPSGYGGPATLAEVSTNGLAVDPVGDIFLASGQEIVAGTGGIVTVAGNGSGVYSGDGGPATSAGIAPSGNPVVDPAGYIIFADMYTYRVRRFSVAATTTVVPATGIPTSTLVTSSSGPTVPGVPMTFKAQVIPLPPHTGTIGGSIQFQDNGVNFGDPVLVSAGSATSPTYTAESPGTHTITAVFTSTVTGIDGSTGSLPGGQTVQMALTSTAVSAVPATVLSGQPVTLTATVTPVSPSPGTPTGMVQFQLDGANFGAPVALNNGTATFTAPAPSAGEHTFTATYAGDGVLFLGSSTGQFVTIAGNSAGYGFSGDGGPPALATLAEPEGEALDAAGNLFFADYANFRVREIVKATGNIITVAGNGSPTYSGDGGPATSAGMSPTDVAVDSAGNLYIADTKSKRIREVVKATGNIITVAGTGTAGYSGDGGPATSAQLDMPFGVAVDSAGNVYIADSDNNRIREVLKATGTIITVAGNGSTGYSGDGGPATAAGLNFPFRIALDSADNLYIADTGHGWVREVVAATGTIITVPGSGGPFVPFPSSDPINGYNLDGPGAIAIDPAGDLFIVDIYNNYGGSNSFDLVWEVIHDTDQTVLIYKAAYPIGYSIMDYWRPASWGLAVDGSGNVTIADTDRTLRRVTMPAYVAVIASTSPVTTTSVVATITAPVYGQPESFVATVAAPGAPAPTGSVQFQVDGINFGAPVPVVDGVAYSSLITSLGAGQHTVTASFSDPSGIFASSGGSISDGLTVSPASTSMSVTSSATSPVVYGQSTTFTATVAATAPSTALPTGTVQFEVDGAPLGGAVTLGPGGVAAISTSTALGVGAHTIAADFVNSSDTFASSTGTLSGSLTVTPAPLSITADNQSRSYGSANPALTVTYSGFVGGDTAASLITPVSVATTATASSPVGSYPITPSDATANNYTITFVPGSLTITPAPLSITADDQSKAYGAALPTLTVSYAGFVNGDSAASLGPPVSVATTATAASHAGTYPITISGAVDPNYAITYTPGTLTVMPVALTVTADDQNKPYGAALQAMTASYTGFVNGDTATNLSTPPTLATGATAASHVGTYPINVSGAVDSDYTISNVPGTLTITPVALTITADSKTKPYGAALPKLTATYTGFVNDDTAASLSTPPTLATTATASSPSGKYPITVSGAADPDYTITYAAGTLTVNPAVAGDYTGTGRTSLALVYRTPNTGRALWFVPGGPSGGLWFGSARLDVPLQGDFNGDGKANRAFYRPSTGQWFIAGQSKPIQYGLPNIDIPVPGDYDDTGHSEIAVYRPTTGQWFIYGHKSAIAFGGPNIDIPVPGDYDGTGHTELAVYRKTTGQWFIRGHATPVQFGAPNLDVPVPADYARTGRTQMAFYRPSTAQWFIAGRPAPQSYGAANLDIPVPGDYDGTGHTEIAVYRPTTGQWYIAGHAKPIQYGGLHFIPLTAPFAYRAAGIYPVAHPPLPVKPADRASAASAWPVRTQAVAQARLAQALRLPGGPMRLSGRLGWTSA